MPRIKVTGIKIEKMCDISTSLINALEKIIQCPRDYFTIECVPSTFIQDGKIVEGNPFIEIGWFDRGQAIQDEVAKAVTSQIQQIGYSNLDIVFTAFEKEKYYENGTHF